MYKPGPFPFKYIKRNLKKKNIGRENPKCYLYYMILWNIFFIHVNNSGCCTLYIIIILGLIILLLHAVFISSKCFIITLLEYFDTFPKIMPIMKKAKILKKYSHSFENFTIHIFVENFAYHVETRNYSYLFV